MERISAQPIAQTTWRGTAHAAQPFRLEFRSCRASMSLLERCFRWLTLGLACQAASSVRASLFTVGEIQSHAALSVGGAGVHVAASPGHGYVVGHKPGMDTCDVLGLHPNGTVRTLADSGQQCTGSLRPTMACHGTCGMLCFNVDRPRYYSGPDTGSDIALSFDGLLVDWGAAVGGTTSHSISDTRRALGWVTETDQKYVKFGSIDETVWTDRNVVTFEDGYEPSTAPPVAVVGNVTLAIDQTAGITLMSADDTTFFGVAVITLNDGIPRARADISCSQPPNAVCGLVWATQVNASAWESHARIYLPTVNALGPRIVLPSSLSQNLPHHASFVVPPYVLFFVQHKQANITAVSGTALGGFGNSPIWHSPEIVDRGAGTFGPIGAAAFNATHGLLAWNDGRVVMVLDNPTPAPTPQPTTAPATVGTLSTREGSAALSSPGTSLFTGTTTVVSLEEGGLEQISSGDETGSPSGGSVGVVVGGVMAAACVALMFVAAYFAYRRRSHGVEVEHQAATVPDDRLGVPKEPEEYDTLPPWPGTGQGTTYGQAALASRAGDEEESGYRRTPIVD